MVCWAYTLLAVLLLLAGPAVAQEGPDLAGQSPVFVDLPGAVYSGNPSDTGSVALRFHMDRDACWAHYGSGYWNACRPRLGLAGQRADVPMDPPLPGVWRWRDDYTLTFAPDTPWQAGQAYTVALDLDALGVPARVVDRGRLGAGRYATVKIRAAPLRVAIRDMRFRQDPSDPARRVVAARLETNYPVEAEALKKRVAFTLVENPDAPGEKRTGPLPFDFTPSKDGRGAEVSVTLKDLPERDAAMVLSVAPGLPPAAGGAATEKASTERARVPSLGTYLALESLSAAVSRAADGTPGHVLALSLNVKSAPEVVRAATRACLLPFAHPVMTTPPDTPYAWAGANAVTPEILQDCAPVDLAPMPGDVGEVAQLAFGFDAPPGRYLYVEVGKSLAAFGGYTLERPARRVVAVPALPHDVEIVQEGAVLPLTGARTLLLQARGTDALAVEVAQIAPAALPHFLAQTRGDITNPSFRGWSFGVEDIATIATARLPMAYEGPSRAQYAGFDLSPYLAGGAKGLFLLTIQGERSGKPVGAQARRFVLVSDLGLMAKMAEGGGGDVFVLSFARGAPAAGAQVSVLGRSGAEIFAARADADGRVRLPDLAAYTRDREPVAIVAQQGADYAFLPYSRPAREMDLSAFDVGGARAPTGGLAALVFTDRGVYKPGEAVEVGLLLRDADARAPGGAGVPLALTVRDPAGRVVADTGLTFAGPGLEDARIQTEKTWPTGPYTATLAIPGESGARGAVLGEAAFRVEDFVPDRLKIAARLAPQRKGWLTPQGLVAEVDLANLYGTPASAREVRGDVTLDPAALRFEGFADHTFYDAYAAPPRRVHYALPPAETDADGRATLPLTLEAQDPASYALTLSTTGFDAGGGRGVTAYARGLVSPAPYVLGYRSDAALSYLRKGTGAQIEVIALDPDLAPAAPEGLTAQLLRVTQVSSLIQRPDGAYAYETVPREEPAGAARPFAPGRVDLSTAEMGDFVWQVADADGRTVLRVPFSVVGAGTRAGGLDRAAVLHLATDKTDYAAGETIEVHITAPYTGSGLITLEAGRVLAAQWFTATGTDSVARIAIPPGFTGKGYVSVAFVRNADSPEIAQSPLAYAVAPFTAGVAERRLDIALAAPGRVEPGAEIAVAYSAPAPGKAVVWAVDAGILQVADYRLPDPLAHFLLDRALGVRTFQMLDLLMPDYALVRRLAAEGGDAVAVAAALGAQLNPFKREDLPPAVWWSGVVDVGPEARTLTFAPPAHFTGTLRVMALAVGADRLGTAQTETLVRGNVVVTPVLPAFLAPGDVVRGSVTVANGAEGSGPDAALALSIQTTGGVTVTTPPPATLPVPEGAERSAPFTLTATDALGPAEVNIQAGFLGGGGWASSTLPLSVRPPVARETTLQAGFAKDGRATFAPARTLYAQGDPQQTLSASALPTAYIAGLRRYLADFPYGCTEQVVSAAFPSVVLDGTAQPAARRAVARAMDTLRARQTGEGAFALWDGRGEHVDPFASLYALDFLLTARDAGFPVPEALPENALRWAREFVNARVQGTADARLKAYGIYLLTRAGFVTTNEVLHWRAYWGKNESWRTDVSAVYIAAAHKMMRQDALAAEVLDAFAAGGLSATSADWQDTQATPALAHAQYVDILARHFPERFAALDRQVVWRLAGFVADGRYNTIAAAWGIRALQAYADGQELGRPAPIRVTADGAAVEGGGVPVGARAITLEAPGDGPLFYTFTQSGFTRGPGAGPVAEGLEIARAYSPAGPVRLGDVVEAVITLRAYERAVEDVVVVDLLPAGFALEREAPTGTLNTQAVEARGDRLIAFADVAPGRDQTLTYRLRAVAAGSFAVPAPYAQAMYAPATTARGVAGRIDVAADAP
jgi:uncharacterized protein YfaS (alpha-2-macroglobulin family)